jgi:hypothetical protein
MKWTILSSTLPRALGAGSNPTSHQAMPKRFRLVGYDGAVAEGACSADTTERDILQWARPAHGFNSIEIFDKPADLIADDRRATRRAAKIEEAKPSTHDPLAAARAGKARKKAEREAAERGSSAP